jgi:hypothetical protein
MAILTKIGRYEVRSELGRGGMATVYLAFDPRFNREVAIKVLPRDMMHDPQFRVRFEREIKMVAGLEHSAITPVYDVGEEDDQPYFVMRYMTGGSLSDWITKRKFSLQETALIIEKVAQGLAYAHKKGVIHRDLKPDNVLFDNNNDPFISDFGVAKLSESAGSLSGNRAIGTPAYMSPEQAQGETLDGRSDVYSLGVIVYQMLSGQQPYRADTPMGVAVKHITEPVPEILKILPSLPPEVDRVIKTALAKDKNQRYSTPLELAQALNLIAFGVASAATTNHTGARSGLYELAAPSHGKTGVSVAGVILLVAVVGFFLLRNQLFTVAQSAAPTMVAIPAQTSVATSAPISATASTPGAQPYAPTCAHSVGIPTPVVAELNAICVKKIPYTLISIPEGATFKTLDSKFSCKIEKTDKGKTSLSCAGKPVFAFDLKVCAPPNASSSNVGKCAQNDIFDSAHQCCLAPPPEGAGCLVFKTAIRSCP